MPESSVKVHLPNGQIVDICTPHGADEFLQTKKGEDFQFFSSNIGDVEKIRSKKKLNTKDKERMKMIYFTMDSLAHHSTQEVFRANVPQKEIEVWVKHVVKELKKMVKNQRWISSGQLEDHDSFILNSCIGMFTHAVPVAISFEKDLFRILAEFVAARKGTTNSLPCTDISETIELIVSNSVLTSLFTFDNTWTGNQIFKQLESSGMLIEFIRCTTVPQPHDSYAPPISVLKTYDELLKCGTFLRKNFKKGNPCGDLVYAILRGKDGYKNNRRIIITKLNTIADMSEITQPQKENTFKLCRKCNKIEMSEEFQRSLMQCARCKMAYYCSRECQKADWKSHRAFCQPATKSDEKRTKTSENTVLNFAKRNFADIMIELVSVCDSTGLPKGELLLELDFRPNKSGKVPALQDPPEFKIAESRGYFEGSRPNEPDWFYKKEDPESYHQTINNFVPAIKDHYNRLLPSHLLCLTCYSGGVTCYKLQLMGTDGTQWFTDQTVDAFRSAIKDEDYSALTRIFDAQQMEMIRKQLFINHGIGGPDEEMINKAKENLNRIFGANF